MPPRSATRWSVRNTSDRGPTLDVADRGYVEDLEADGAAGNRDLDRVALLLADQTLADRARREDAALVRVLLAGADQVEGLFLVHIQIHHLHPAAEGHGVLGQGTGIDDDRAGEPVRYIVDARLQD